MVGLLGLPILSQSNLMYSLFCLMYIWVTNKGHAFAYRLDIAHSYPLFGSLLLYWLKEREALQLLFIILNFEISCICALDFDCVCVLASHLIFRRGVNNGLYCRCIFEFVQNHIAPNMNRYWDARKSFSATGCEPWSN